MKVHFRAIERGPGDFQESVSPVQIQAMTRGAFQVVTATEIGGGLYNNTYRVTDDSGRDVVLRVAPEPRKQARSERELMRNEQAALPFFAPIASMMPQTLMADWTHEVIKRDYVWQTMLSGVSAMDVVNKYDDRDPLYRQIGAIAKRIHAVEGVRFGRVAGPLFGTWSAAIIAGLRDIVADLETVALDATDVEEVIAIAEQNATVLDEVTEPRLLHGDLWVPNVLVAPDRLRITGVLDHDRASWGDPAADWPVFMARSRNRAAFWETYGHYEETWRDRIYHAWHLGAIRLERHRLKKDDRVRDSYDQLREVIRTL
jgi:aminoglycoside phosphotransferase (APT) family kinase protein